MDVEFNTAVIITLVVYFVGMAVILGLVMYFYRDY